MHVRQWFPIMVWATLLLVFSSMPIVELMVSEGKQVGGYGIAFAQPPASQKVNSQGSKPKTDPKSAVRVKSREQIIDDQLELAGRNLLDDFEGSTLSPEWQLRFDGTAKDWKTSVADSKLLVKDIVGKEGYAIARLSRPVAISGEFKLDLKFEWTSSDSGPETNKAMQVLLVNLRNGHGDIIMSHGYIDENNTNRGSPVGGIQIGPDLLEFQLKQYKQAATPGEFANSLDASGKVHLTIVRDATGLMTGTFEGGGKLQVLRGIYPATVAEVELEFRRYILENATFEGLAVDRISLTGVSTLTESAIAKSVRAALLKEERDRTDAEKTLLATRGPRILPNRLNTARQVNTTEPAIKTGGEKPVEPKIQTARNAPKLKPAGRPVFPGMVVGIEVSPDNKQIAVAGMFEPVLVDTATGRVQTAKSTEGKPPGGQLLRIQFTPSGKLAIREWAGGKQGAAFDKLFIQDLASGKSEQVPVGINFGHHAFHVFPDEQYVLAAGTLAYVRIYKMGVGIVAKNQRAAPDAWSVAVTPDQRLLAVGQKMGQVFIYQLPTKEDLQSATVDQPTLIKFVSLSRKHTGTVVDVEFSSDGKTLATGDHEGTVWLWDVDSQQLQVSAEPRFGIEGVYFSFSPDSKFIATVDGESKKLGLRGAIWDVASGKALHLLDGGHDFSPTRVRFDLTGTKVYTTEGKSIQVWNLPKR